MYRLIYSLIILLFLVDLGFTQTLEEFQKKIDAKLRRDKNYLNLNYLDFTPDFQAVPAFRNSFPRVEGREPFSFSDRGNIRYRLVYLKQGLDIDSVYLLYLMKIETTSAEGDELISGLSATQQEDVSRVLNFMDMYNLKLNHPPLYSFLLTLVYRDIQEKEESDAKLPTLLGIQPDKEIKTSIGMSSRDNKDYYNYVTVNTPAQWYPKVTEEKQTFGRQTKKEDDFSFSIDASFSHLSFSHRIMSFGETGGASLMLSTRERVMNMIPWENMTLGVGAKLLFRMDENPNPYLSNYIDATLMARIRMPKTSFLDGRYIAEHNPFSSGDSPLLNFGTGISLDLTLTRPFSLPTVKLYLAKSDEEFKDPNAYRNITGGYVAYHTSTQAEFTFSFFWNSSDKLVHRFGMDVGAAYYNIYEANYDTKLNFKRAKLIQDKFIPVLVFNYNFVPKDPLLGFSLRMFDNHANMWAWIKLIDLYSVHRFRFEVNYVTAPFARQRRAWETEGGAMFQLRYRLGIN
jgi:hypothetical protein